MEKLRLSICMAALALGGCMATTPEVDPKVVQAYLADKPAELHKLFSKVATGGEHNRVRYLLPAGLASMELGHDALAARTFDDALLTIETMYGGDEKAEEVRSNFTAENRKTFRGEPYERAMAFYYRGILYLKEGDYENARASFRSGSLQDTLAEREVHQQDFALLEFLEGWASQCNGNTDLAAEAFALAKEHDPEAMLPQAGHNLLVLADLGHAPVKYGEGEHSELLKIRANSGSYDASPSFRLGGAPERLFNRESILRQAKTRGGREFDAILEGKAQFKEGMETASQVAGDIAKAGMTAGMAGLASGNEDLARIGGVAAIGGGVVSIFTGMVAQETKPQADTRQWDNLPEAVLYGTYRVDPGTGGAGVSHLPGKVREGGDSRCRVAWTRYPGTDQANVGISIAGKVFSGKADYGKHSVGVIPYMVTFLHSGAASVTQGSGWGLFCGGTCAVTMSGTWNEEGDRIKLKYSRPPIREIDALVEFRKNDDILEGNLVNNNRFDGKRYTAKLRLREKAPEG